MEDEEIKTYSPPVEDSSPLPVDADTTGFDDVLNDDGLIDTKLNEKVIIKRIAKDLYKNATSGLRELYNNSVRACRVAQKKHGEEKPLIQIYMNASTRKLVISDNGIGISRERFKRVLLELGTSDNLEAGEVGQFGMGFASYMTLSSVIVIDTRARATNEQYRMIAKDGMSFQPVGDCQMEGFGTRLDMTCYENVDFRRLAETIQKFAKYSGIPTEVEFRGFEYLPRNMSTGVNKIPQTSFDDDVNNTKTAKRDKIDIDTDDFHLIALVAGGYNAVSNYDHIHLLNVPIESDISLPFSWYVLNIKDERKFKPMPDRDRMTEEADNRLKGLLDREIKKYFADLDIQNYKQFLESNRKNEFLWLTSHEDYAPPHLESILEELDRCNVRTVKYDTKSFDDGSIVMKLASNPHVIYQGYKNRIVTSKVKEFEPKSTLLTTKKTKKNNWRESVDFMVRFGIPTTKQILLDHKVKLPKNEKLELELVGHTHDGYYNHDIIALDDIDENVIRVDSVPMVDMIRFVKKFKTPYTFVRNASELDEYESRDYSEWLISDVPNIMVATNKGAKTIAEIAKEREDEDNVIFCADFETEFEYFFKEDKRLIVYGTDGLLPLLLFLNPNCEIIRDDYNYEKPWVPKNEVQSQHFHQFVEEKYNVSLNSDEGKKFFCANMMKIRPCFHQLLGHLIKETRWDMEDDKCINLWNTFLKKIQKYEPFDDKDDIAKLLFYYSEEVKVADKASVWGETLRHLLDSVKYKIDNNEFLKARLVKEHILPKIFGHIEFRSMVKEQLSYVDSYEISIATHDTEFDFRDNMEVLDFKLSFNGCKMKINKGYCSIKLTVRVSS